MEERKRQQHLSRNNRRQPSRHLATKRVQEQNRQRRLARHETVMEQVRQSASQREISCNFGLGEHSSLLDNAFALIDGTAEAGQFTDLMLS